MDNKSSTGPDRSDSHNRANKKKADKLKVRSSMLSSPSGSTVSSEMMPSGIKGEPSTSRSVYRPPIQNTEKPIHHKQHKVSKPPSFRFVMPKPECIVIDLLGTIVTKKFMSTSNDIRSFAKKHLNEYLEDNWRKKPLRVILNYFRGSQRTCPESLKLGEKHEMSKEEAIALARNHILYRMKAQPDSPAVGIFMLGITEWGYSKKLLVTPVYPEVQETLKTWNETHKFPVYMAVGSPEFLLMVLTATTSGNLIPFFKGHMNLTDFDGNKVNKDFKKLLGLLKIPPGRVLYLTRFRSDARKAIESGLMSMIVLRHDFDSNNLIPAVHKWRAKNQTLADKPSSKRGDAKAPPPVPKTEDGTFIKKLGTALGLEAIVTGGPSWETQRHILINASEDMDPTKLRNPSDEQAIHYRSSQLLEEDLDYYKVLLSLDELVFT